MATPHPTAYERDLYKVLQVHPRAQQEVIDAAYKSLLKLCAPRAEGDSETAASALGEAHMILANPRERRKYDEYRKNSAVKNTIGPYRIIKEVAQGGFGTTYKAEHALLGEHSCIKYCSEISPASEEILRQETRAIWNLRHYGLPSMRDLLRLEDDSYALAMSWIEGPTLQQAIEKNGRPDPENVAWVAERILNTLVYLHHHGVLHGDIKPQNIIVQEDTHIVVLVDFGLSEVKPSAASRSKGYTELFSPPEQIAGKTLVPGSDFYSLGMTMLYALGGGFKAAERKEVPADVPDPMCDFIKSLIVRNVLERPTNTEKLFETFQKVRLESFGRDRSNMKQFSVK